MRRPSARELTLRAVGRVPRSVRDALRRRPLAHALLSRLLGRVVSDRRPVVVTIAEGPLRGFRLALDRGTPRFYWLAGHDEEHVLAALESCLAPGMVAADVGAHIGLETLLMSRAVGESGSVLSFEPDPANVRRLRRNCELNGLRNVEIIEAAVSDRAGTIALAATGTVESHVASAGEETAVSVRSTTLDEALTEGRGRLDLAKIDVEGHEAAVLRGAARTLAEHRPAVVVEIHHREALADCMQLLAAADYRVERLDSGPVDDTEFVRCHLLATPGEAR